MTDPHDPQPAASPSPDEETTELLRFDVPVDDGVPADAWQPGDRGVVLEPFRLGTVPAAADMVVDAANQKPAKSAPARPVDPALAEADLGGLY